MLSRHRRGHGDNGATLVESAVVTPVLLLFIFGIFEFGFAFRDYLAVANSTRDAAREASVAGNVLDADYRMMRAIERASAALPDGAIEEIVIWEASGPTDTVPSGCQGALAGTAGLCNVYRDSALSLPESSFGCQEVALGDPLDSPDRFWCPGDREVSVGAGLDYVGVYIRITHEYITGLFGDEVVFEDQMILKVEPQEQ
ncbi:MAG: TadE/TadG family type IV pilus assembly protein [Actinomycetota bacterium]